MRAADTERPDSVSWQAWEVPASGAPRRVGAGAAELKELLVGPSGEAGLRVILAAVEGDSGDWLGPLARLGLAGTVVDEAVAAALPEPYRARRLGYLPGIERDGGMFLAFQVELAGTDGVAAQPARQRLWAELRGWLDGGEAGDGGARSLCLCGPAGSGKSFLLQALVAELNGGGAAVRRSACLPSDPVGGFRPWLELIGSVDGGGARAALEAAAAAMAIEAGLARVAIAFLHREAEAAALSQEQHRDVLPRLVAGALEAAAEDEGTLVLDDTHWLDGPGRQVWSRLRRSRRSLRLLAARRGRPASPEEREIDPLGEDEFPSLLRDLGEGLDPTAAFCDEMLRISGGLPLVAGEVYAALRGAGRLRVVGRRVELAPGALAWLPRHETGATVGAGARLAALPEDLAELLGRCAAWRRPFTRDELEWVVRPRLGGVEVEEALADPRVRDFLGARGDGRYAFHHDLIREAAHGRLGEEPRREAHRRVLERLSEAAVAEAAELGYHAERAGERERAVECYDRAAAEALGRFALREAMELAESAARLDRDDGGEWLRRRARRRQVRGEAAFHSGLLDEATELLEGALVDFGATPELGVIQLRRDVAWRQLRMLARGRPGASGAASAERLAPPRAALMLGEIAYFQDQRQRSALWCLLALDLAERAGESAFLASLCAAIACPLTGRRPRWIGRCYRALGRQLIERLDDVDQAAYIEHVGALTDLGRGAWRRAADGAAASASYWRRRGHGRREEESWIFAYYSAYFLGRLEQADEACRALEGCVERRTDPQSRLWAGVLLTLQALRCEGPEAAEALGERMELEGGDVMTRYAVGVVRAAAAWRLNHPWRALERLHEVRALAQLEPPVSPVQVQALEAAVLLGEMRWWGPPGLAEDADFRELWRQSIAVARAYARAFPFGRPLAVAAEALRERERSERRARRLLVRARGRAERLGMALERARCGAWLALLGGARPALTELEACGAQAEAKHFHDLIRSHS